MFEPSSLANRPVSVLSHARTLRSELKAATEHVNDIALELAETSTQPTIFQRKMTIQLQLGNAVTERTVAEFVCAIDLESEFPEYLKQGAALALRDGVEVNL